MHPANNLPSGPHYQMARKMQEHVMPPTQGGPRAYSLMPPAPVKHSPQLYFLSAHRPIQTQVIYRVDIYPSYSARVITTIYLGSIAMNS